MFNKETKELEQILESTHSNEIEKFFKENKEDFLSSDEREFYKFMKARVKEKGLTQTRVYIDADIEDSYGGQLFREEKHTDQRDTILRICYGAQLTMLETQQALKIYGMKPLYVRDARDVVLMNAFNEHNEDIHGLNKMLEELGMDKLRECKKEKT